MDPTPRIEKTLAMAGNNPSREERDAALKIAMELVRRLIPKDTPQKKPKRSRRG